MFGDHNNDKPADSSKLKVELSDERDGENMVTDDAERTKVEIEDAEGFWKIIS